jgi:UDP-glucose 4-epimerase
MKKVMITGCSGYIGSHLCKLLEGKYEVHGLDLHDPIVPINKFYKVDINRLFTIPDQTDPYDAVIHLAALVNVGESEKMPIMYYITNLNGTMNVLNKIPTKNFIFASTGAAALCESAYGISKRAAEDCITEFYTRHREGIDYTMFRFYNVIGSSYGIKPTNPDGLMYNLMNAKDRGEFTIYGNDYNTPDGTCIRDYVHVMEICNALELAVEKPANGLENLGHGIGKTVKDMVELYKIVNNVDFTVKYGPRRKGDAAVSVLDNPSTYMKHLYDLKDLLKVSV